MDLSAASERLFKTLITGDEIALRGRLVVTASIAATAKTTPDRATHRCETRFSPYRLHASPASRRGRSAHRVGELLFPDVPIALAPQW